LSLHRASKHNGCGALAWNWFRRIERRLHAGLADLIAKNTSLNGYSGAS
jgi:hypothetical protein